MFAIFKREFLSYFRSPVGYIALALFSFLSGFVFVNAFSYGVVDISSEIISLRGFFVVIVPIITMGLFAEEKKKGTEVIYYTSPMPLYKVVVGKFLAALSLFAVMFMIIVIHMLVTLYFGGKIDASSLGATIVFFVLASLFISIGIFISSVCDSQIVAAILSFVAIMVVQMLPTIGSLASNAFSSMASLFVGDTMPEASAKLAAAITWLDPMKKTDSFIYGIFSMTSLVYCLSFTAFFIFLTYRLLEKKRWSQS